MEDSDDELYEDLIQRLVYYVSFWYAGRVTTQEDFDALNEDAVDYGLEVEPGTVEEQSVEEQPTEEKPKEEKPKRKPRKTAKKKEELAKENLKKEG